MPRTTGRARRSSPARRPASRSRRSRFRTRARGRSRAGRSPCACTRATGTSPPRTTGAGSSATSRCATSPPGCAAGRLVQHDPAAAGGSAPGDARRVRGMGRGGDRGRRDDDGVARLGQGRDRARLPGVRAGRTARRLGRLPARHRARRRGGRQPAHVRQLQHPRRMQRGLRARPASLPQDGLVRADRELDELGREHPEGVIGRRRAAPRARFARRSGLPRAARRLPRRARPRGLEGPSDRQAHRVGPARLQPRTRARPRSRDVRGPGAGDREPARPVPRRPPRGRLRRRGRKRPLRAAARRLLPLGDRPRHLAPALRLPRMDVLRAHGPGPRPLLRQRGGDARGRARDRAPDLFGPSARSALRARPALHHRRAGSPAPLPRPHLPRRLPRS